MTRGLSSWNSSKGNVELATNEFALAQRAPNHRFSTSFSSAIRHVSREKRSFLALKGFTPFGLFFRVYLGENFVRIGGM